jgi:DNA-binding NarL/FixJ family response regulator
MPIRVALVDDHPLVLEGLERLFRLHPDMEVIAQRGNADEAFRMVKAEHPDVMVLDLLMPGSSGLELLRALEGELERTSFVLLTAVADDDQLLEAIRLGGGQGVVRAGRARALSRLFVSLPTSDRRSRDRAPIAVARKQGH